MSLEPVDVAAAEPPPFGARPPGAALLRIVRATRACGAGWAGMRRAFALRKLGQKLVGEGAVDIEALGAKMRLHPGDNIVEKRLLYTPQYFDPAERALLARRLRPDLVFLDIGANVGAYALEAARLAGPTARIIAVEAQREVYERLIYNIRQNAFATIKAIECALADREAQVTLFLDPRNRARASIRMLHGDGEAEPRVTRARPLAGLVADEKLTRIDALKIDVSGAEDVILEPFLRAAPPALWPGLLIVDLGALAPGATLAPVLSDCGYREILRSRANVAYERI